MDQYAGTVAVHPVLGCVRTISEALDEVTTCDPVYLTTRDKADAIRELGVAAARLDELRLRVLAAADDVAETTGAKDAGAWAAHELRLDPSQGRRDQRLARALDQRYPHLRERLADGRVHRQQAEVIVKALDRLPGDLDPEVTSRAERQLTADAAHFDPRRLRTLGDRILEVAAPEVAEEHQRRLLERDDARAAATTSLTTRTRGDGTTDIRARVADHVAQRLLGYLHAFTNPRRPDARDDDRPAQSTEKDTRPYPHRLGHAFAAFLGAVDPTRLPLHGGSATTLLVTVDWQTLRDGIGTATLPDGSPLSAGEARRLACTADWLPAVMDGPSQILDLGRLQRLFKGLVRRAMAARDKTCRADGCDVPADWCEAHHRTPWARGGTTTLTDGVLLCSFHHHRAHDPRYDTTYRPKGGVTFHRRT